MAMPAHTLEWTADMARAIHDDGYRHEVLDGALFVTPAPAWRHQQVLRQPFRALGDYVEAQRIGWALWAPADVEFSPRRLVQPDLFVVPWADREPASSRDISRLVLAVEVLSPSTARADRHVKRRLYQDEGVAEYWVVDPDARLIERWRPADTRPELCDESITWGPREDVPPLTISFEAVCEHAGNPESQGER
jgi:Uma2 family endonuclease